MPIKQYPKYKEKIPYLQARPEIAKIFSDLEELLDFCRFELLPYNPSDLYNKKSRVWHLFEAYKNPDAPRGKRPYLGKKPNKYANKQPYIKR